MPDELDIEQLASELAAFEEATNEGARSPLEERVIAGFGEVQRWVAEHGRFPRHGEEFDIFERLFATRLDRLRSKAELRSVVESLDTQGLLAGEAESTADAATLSADELAAELAGIESSPKSEIAVLTHVRSRAEIEAAEEVANRKPCADFEGLRPLFEELSADLKSGVRRALPFNKDIGNNTDARVRVGDFYILGGLFVYVAEIGELYKTPEGAPQARLRVIYGNGTESNLLIRSLQNALYKDPAGRRITAPEAGPLFVKHDDADH